MSVKIRLKRMGSKKKPFYRLIAADSRMPRDGRFLETVGYYNPMTTPADIHVNEEALFKWLGNGATPSVSAASLLRQAGSLQKWALVKSGVTGEELETRVEAIKNQRIATAQRKDLAKSGEKSKKAVAKEAAEAEAAATKAAEAEAEAAKAAEEKAAKAPVEEAAPATEEKAAEAPAEEVAEPAPEAAPAPKAEEPKKDE